MVGVSAVESLEVGDLAETTEDYALFVLVTTRPARKWPVAVVAPTPGDALASQILLCGHPDLARVGLGDSAEVDVAARVIGTVDLGEDEDVEE